MLPSVLRFANRATCIKVVAKVSRFVDYESLYYSAMKKLDEQDDVRNAKLGTCLFFNSCYYYIVLLLFPAVALIYIYPPHYRNDSVSRKKYTNLISYPNLTIYIIVIIL